MCFPRYNNFTKDIFSNSFIFFLFLDSRRHEPLHFLVEFAQLFEVSSPVATEERQRFSTDSGTRQVRVLRMGSGHLGDPSDPAPEVSELSRENAALLPGEPESVA